jgi:8-oxo-dGTP pyrophosphatase MutT (NUDIX family)
MDLAQVADPSAAPAIRAAATLILWRPGPSGAPEVLMGQRGTGAAFMPSKYVFPGGAMDPADSSVSLGTALPQRCAARLSFDSAIAPDALAAAGIRELWEETGLLLGTPGKWPTAAPPDRDEDWARFAALGLRPAADAMRFVFRAITPPGRSRRFDARFFLVSAASITGDPDDFSAASDELSHLHWIALSEARSLDLPFITEVVLAEVGATLRDPAKDSGVPFFDNSGPNPVFRRIA